MSNASRTPHIARGKGAHDWQSVEAKQKSKSGQGNLEKVKSVMIAMDHVV